MLAKKVEAAMLQIKRLRRDPSSKHPQEDIKVTIAELRKLVGKEKR